MQLLEDLRQRHLEAFDKHFYNEHKPEHDGLAAYRGAVVRAAIAAGWSVDVANVDAVAEMSPKEVIKASIAIDDLYRECTTLDPNS